MGLDSCRAKVLRDQRRALHRYIAQTVDMNIAAEAVLDTFFTPDCPFKVPAWGILAGMCDGRRLLEYQEVTAAGFLRAHPGQSLSRTQARILEVQPRTRTYLSGFCGCGCLRAGGSACAGCGRVFYFSKACQKECVIDATFLPTAL